MPPSLFNNLAHSLQETESFLTAKRAHFANLSTRHEAFTTASSSRSTRLNQLARRNTDLVAAKADCRRRIEEEQRKLKDHEASRAAISQELEGVRLEVAEAEDVRKEMLGLQDEIIAVDDELQEFKALARKIQRRARGAVVVGASIGVGVAVVPDDRHPIAATPRSSIRKRRGSSCITVRDDEPGNRPVKRKHIRRSPSVNNSPQRKVNFVVAVPSTQPQSPKGSPQLKREPKRPMTFRCCALTPSIEDA